MLTHYYTSMYKKGQENIFQVVIQYIMYFMFILILDYKQYLYLSVWCINKKVR